VTEFCRSGAIEESIETVKGALRERRDVLCEALERELPEARFVPPEGGYFLWVELPEGVPTADLHPEGVTFVPGSDFFCGPGGENAVRLAFSYETPAAIEEAVRRLASAVRAAMLLRRAA
jgi:2-aminoadipate transaminase